MIEIDFKNIPEINSRLNENTVKSIVDRFLKDMKNDVSSFFHLAEKSTWQQEISRHSKKLEKLKKTTKNFLHLGIGGSSLGAETLVKALHNPRNNDCSFSFLDNIDPDYLDAILFNCKPEQTAVYVVSKSGGTMETLAQLCVIYEWLSAKLGPEQAKEQFIFCTDPQNGALRSLANEWGSVCFEIPPNLGGRFSALSAVGLLPCWWAGIDTDAILRGLFDYQKLILSEYSDQKTPSVVSLARLIVSHYLERQTGITVLMPYSQRLKTLSSWFVQLWAESLGKELKGLTPVGAVGATDQHSILQLLRDGPLDKITGFIEIGTFAKSPTIQWSGPDHPSFSKIVGVTMDQLLNTELEATTEVLKNGKRPYFKIIIPELNEYRCGQLLFCLEVLTAISGYLLDINPFDQPGVEEGKTLTLKKLDYLRSKVKINH